MTKRTSEHKSKPEAQRLKMFLVPCSCGTTFAVAENYDHPDRKNSTSTWSRYLKCPSCGKRHDPKNRLLELGYHREGYGCGGFWEVDAC
jgi:hypothetical protein